MSDPDTGARGEPAFSPVVRAVGVGFRYPSAAVALRDIRLEGRAGEIVALVGPNGAGKSTLLRLLAGALSPQEGTLELPLRRGPEGCVTTGYAGEEVCHFESLTGTDNAVFFARAAGLAREDAEIAVREHFDRLRLSPDADRRVSTYSGGARRKLLLVAALVHRPLLTLLDEPFVGLDLESREALVGLLRERAGEGGAVIIASHDLALLPELADRIVFLHDARVVAEGRTAELLSSVPDVGRFEFTLDGSFDESAFSLPAGMRLADERDALVLESDRGQAALAEACAAVAASGARIRSVVVRDAGLAAVFRNVTGAELGE